MSFKLIFFHFNFNSKSILWNGKEIKEFQIRNKFEIPNFFYVVVVVVVLVVFVLLKTWISKFQLTHIDNWMNENAVLMAQQCDKELNYSWFLKAFSALMRFNVNDTKKKTVEINVVILKTIKRINLQILIIAIL